LSKSGDGAVVPVCRSRGSRYTEYPGVVCKMGTPKRGPLKNSVCVLYERPKIRDPNQARTQDLFWGYGTSKK